ncbi:hypothetical protein [Streptomyces alboflavus]|uniref:hypothetical protein n=1 Tax=Streptomyces alboflavus TaxID=67267 RepID=UPI0004C14177|nr:hypothetical protein [Streptomyces alboflavus]
MTSQPDPLTAEQLDQIEARANAATPGPWCTDAWEIYQGTEYQPGISLWIGETCRGTSSPEQDRADAAFVAAARTDVPALLTEVRRLHAALEEIRHLHKDSPMGPCPLCIDADAAAAGGDGLVPFPCPTARLAGAQDCDPPHMREGREAAACGKCGTPFAPADTRHDGHARHGLTDYCRRCVDRCHESTDFAHACAVCL